MIDDYPGMGDSLSHTLRGEGYDLTRAANGQEALNALRTTGFDLVLLNLDMPVTNGWDAFSQIVTTSLALPLIILTSDPDREPLAPEVAATAVLRKPIDLTLLLGVMRRALAETSEARGKGAGPASTRLP